MTAWGLPGRHVVCRRRIRWWKVPVAWCLGVELPVVGHVYTVREQLVSYGQVGIRLVEIRNAERGWRDGYCEPCFGLDRFAPVRTSDIESLRDLLVPTPGVPVRECA